MKIGFLIGTAMTALASSALAHGPEGYYYIASGDQQRIDVLHGHDIDRTWNTPDFEYPIVVTSTVKTYGTGEGNVGREYTLNGVATGTTYTNTGTGTFYDGATDGRSNYAINWDNGDLVQFDGNWANPQTLFNTGGGGNHLGVTYDPSNDSFWIAEFSGQTVSNVTRDGTVLTSFESGITTGQAALALDYADGTLWMVEYTQSGKFFQFARSGSGLATITYEGLAGVNPLGGEFAIPAPGAAGLLALAGLVAGRRRRA